VARIQFGRRDFDIRRNLENMSGDVERFLDWLEDSSASAPVPEYRPPIDILETSEALDIVADLPGVAADAVRVVYTQGGVLILGRKTAPGCHHREAAFHLAERTFGRFAWLVRLSVAVDAGRARATLQNGELLVSLPRIEDRRGRDQEIKVESL
jgi:HSP20 family protein